ncbi:toxin-antitoxin system HicB family antitoxin [Bdellovibrionales bacterium]|nr:toxin-antitoxin system HicB family antitoxin [Bdellovibrionales bacterium]
MENFNPKNYQVQITSFIHSETGKTIFCGRVTELKNIYVEEKTVKKAYDRIIDELHIFKKHYDKNNLEFPNALIDQEFSGDLRVRLGKDLHKQIAMEAARGGLSLNKYIKDKLKAS